MLLAITLAAPARGTEVPDARASMPGMMDTVLNLGLNDRTVEALAASFQDERFAYDSYRRFIQMYCNVVLDLPGHGFGAILEEFKERRRWAPDANSFRKRAEFPRM